MGLDNKISFISGFVLTSIWTMSIYELAMALFLGIIGGIGGIIGKWIVRRLGWFGQNQDRRFK
jgi:hypothetical protein